MTLDELSDIICAKLPKGATCIYGCNGTAYLYILVPYKGRIISIGHFIYRAFREGLFDETMISELQRASLDCYQRKKKGEEVDEPVLCYCNGPRNLQVRYKPLGMGK
jgi:hypothetical protein